MRQLPILLALFSLCALPVQAKTHTAPPHHAAAPNPAAPAIPAGPKSIGTFQNWQAATHEESGKQACYAFTRAPGRTDIVLTVTQRAEGRDAVAISTGNALPDGTETSLDVNGGKLPFYAAQQSLFARDGHKVTLAFAHATTADLKLPPVKGKSALYHFSLRGFPQAYAAINKACPE